MKMPGFSAEGSFQRTMLAYNMTWNLDQSRNKVWPQHCNEQCYSTCTSNCDCAAWGIPPSRCFGFRLGCERACAASCGCSHPPLG
jgi:hypothetical protein